MRPAIYLSLEARTAGETLRDRCFQRCVCLVALLCALGAPAAEDGSGPGPKDAKELERFTDEIMAVELPRCHVPGVVFVLVKDGQVFFAKGYGYADLETKRPVEVEKTLFRVYSVSKSVTAIAAMQLVEQGKLALDRDINSYLRPKGVPSTFPQPITLADLLTHTSGLDDRYILAKPETSAFSDPVRLLPLDQYLAHSLPPRLCPPGQIIRYSNQNLVLVGYLIEAASGEPFGQYLLRHVLGPLEMRHSSWCDSQEFARDLACGYSFNHGRYRRLALSGSCNPASSLIATATDMGHFMIAQLQHGRYADQQILRPDTVGEMQSSKFSLDVRLPGVGYGFWERFIRGERTVEHAGDAPGFISIMRLLPGRGQGLFISVNSNEGGTLLRAVEHSYFDRYFPYIPPTVPVQARPSPGLRPATFAGSYRRDFIPSSGIEKLLLLARGGQQVRVIPTTEGVALEFGPFRRTYVEEAPLLFRETSGSERIGFKQSTDGHWLLSLGPYGLWERLPFYDTFGFQILWLAVCFIMLISFIGIWPLIWLLRRSRKRRDEVSKPGRGAVAAAAAASVASLAAVAGGTLVLLGLIETDFMLGGAASMPVSIKALLLLPPIEAAVSFALIWFSIQAWRGRFWTVPARIHYSMVAVASLSLTAWFEHWNILRWWFTS